MNSVKVISPILTVIPQTPGVYLVRISDKKWTSLSTAVIKLLPDARQVAFVSPEDTKLIELNGATPRAVVETQQVEDLQTSEAEPIASEEPPVPVEEAEPVKRGRGRPRKDSIAAEQDCRRCGGTGEVFITLDGGKQSQTVCHICKGKGKAQYFGEKPSSRGRVAV